MYACCVYHDLSGCRRRPSEGAGMADKKKKQAGRRAYLNDFHRDLTGAYIYDGSHFHFAGDGWKQALLRLWALGIVLVVLVLAGGFSGETMSHCVFQILPYLVEVGAVGSVVWALVRLTSGGETLRAYVYKATVQALPGRAVLVMCAAGAGMLGTALCMIVHGTAGRLAGLLLCLLLKAALLAGAWLLRRYVQTLPWEGPPEETAD